VLSLVRSSPVGALVFDSHQPADSSAAVSSRPCREGSGLWQCSRCLVARGGLCHSRTGEHGERSNDIWLEGKGPPIFQSCGHRS
jgi:hypothetical protein